MLGIVIFFSLSLCLSPWVCGGLLEYEVWCQEAKSASHTDLIHQGRRVLVEAVLAGLFNMLTKLPHLLVSSLLDDNAKTSP